MKFRTHTKRRGVAPIVHRKRTPMYLSVVPRGTQYSIETMNCTYPMIFAGGAGVFCAAEIPTNLPWLNQVGTNVFPNFERYKLLYIKVQFIPGPAFYNSTPQIDGTPPFFGGVHMCSFNSNQQTFPNDLDFTNSYKNAKHYNPYTHDKMVCYWNPSTADTIQQRFKILPSALAQAHDWDDGGVRIVIETSNNLAGEAQAQAIGELQLTFKLILIGKLAIPFRI